MLHRTLLVVLFVLFGVISTAFAQETALPENMQTFVDALVDECGGDASRVLVHQEMAQYEWYEVGIFCETHPDLDGAGAPEGLEREGESYYSSYTEGDFPTLVQSLAIRITVEPNVTWGQQVSADIVGYGIDFTATVEDGVLVMETVIVNTEEVGRLHSMQVFVLNAEGEALRHDDYTPFAYMFRDVREETQETLRMPLPYGAASVRISVYTELSRCGCEISNMPALRYDLPLAGQVADGELSLDGFEKLELPRGVEVYYTENEGTVCYAGFGDNLQHIVIGDVTQTNVAGNAYVSSMDNYGNFNFIPGVQYCVGTFEMPNNVFYISAGIVNEEGATMSVMSEIQQ